MEQDDEDRVVKVTRRGALHGTSFEAEQFYRQDGALGAVGTAPPARSWELRLGAAGAGAASTAGGIPASVLEPQHAAEAGLERRLAARRSAGPAPARAGGGPRPLGALRTGGREYASRLSRYLRFELGGGAQARKLAGTPRAREEEGASLLARLSSRECVVALDERGEELTSPGLAERVRRWQERGQDVTLVIGGADGLAPEVLERASEAALSLALAHGLARLVLLEQLYRAMTILRGGTVSQSGPSPSPSPSPSPAFFLVPSIRRHPSRVLFSGSYTDSG